MEREEDRKGKRQRTSKHNENRVKGRRKMTVRDSDKGQEGEREGGGKDRGRHKIIRLLPWQ